MRGETLKEAMNDSAQFLLSLTMITYNPALLMTIGLFFSPL